MPSSPNVSVCIPVYNGERFLAETVLSALTQTYRDFEVVVLDNASTDRTPDILAAFSDPRLRIVRNRSLMPRTDNWNKVVELSGAPLVKFLCADDLMHPRCLELQVGPLQRDDGVAMVAARRHMIDENSRVIASRRGLTGLIGEHSGSEVARRVVRNGANPIGEPGGVLFRREHFVAAGEWRPDRSYVMDLDLWIRLLQYGTFVGLPETLAAFRISRATLSADNDREIYDEQRSVTTELGGSPYFAVRPVDLRIGRMLAPAGRARRRALYVASKLSVRRQAAQSTRPEPALWGNGDA